MVLKLNGGYIFASRARVHKTEDLILNRDEKIRVKSHSSAANENTMHRNDARVYLAMGIYILVVNEQSKFHVDIYIGNISEGRISIIHIIVFRAG